MGRTSSRPTPRGSPQASRNGRPRQPPPPRGNTIARTAFPIAVAGASAGGLEAFKRLLSALPARCGMAFIVIPHLDPMRESRMVELLARASAMPVTAAVEGRRIRPDHVYVIPPNRLLAVHAGRLELKPLPDPRAARTALDLALRSLAKDRGANAVGIVLSGTGSHGAAGLKEILRAGGLVLAQDPATAQYDQMPRSAAAAGVPAHHVLTPESMAAVLVSHAERLAGRDTEPARSLPRYRFFHDTAALDALVAEALAGLVNHAIAGRPLRVWVPESGTGEEAYSIAMLLLERLEAINKGATLKLFATAADAEALRVGRLGIYPECITETVSRERLTRFFKPVSAHQYQVSSELRQSVVFGQLDLASDPPISKLDLLVCREPSGNLSTERRARLIGHLHFALNPGGYLLLGPGAPEVAGSGLFEMVSEKSSLYRKSGKAPQARAQSRAGTARAPEAERQRRQTTRVAAPATAGRLISNANETSWMNEAHVTDQAHEMDQALLERLAPAAILMDARYRILATRGPVTKYLRIAPRMPLPSLLAAADASLRAAALSACEQAVLNQRWVRHDGSPMRHDGHFLSCTVSARSLRDRASGEPRLLVIFEDDGARHRKRHEEHASALRKVVSNDDLQAALADLQHAHDDLEASNEQMTSMNEELQSASEDLQSSNEEMQALNEELESSKASLQESVVAAERVEAQLRAVLDATVDAVVAVNADGKIVTFNGSASRMFGYSLHEVIGRNVNMLLPPEIRTHQDECLARYWKTRQRHVAGTSREVVAYRRDGIRFPALLSVTETANGQLLVGCLKDLTADKAMQEEILRIAMLEQQRIGQDLHDGTQQELTGLGLLAQNLSDELEESGSAGAALAKRLAAGIADANRQVRALAHGLVSVPVDAESLPAALGELARNTADTHKLSCRFECTTPVRMPDAGTATHLYRIAQEAVGNAARHSKANDVLIRLAHDDNRLRLEVHDDGVGIAPQPAANGGVGLRLMEHRCNVIGGRFAIEP